MARPRWSESDEEFEERIKRPNPWIAYVGLAVILFCCGAVLFPVWQGARVQGRASHSLSNVKQLVLGVMMYENDADDRAPLAANWMDAILPYLHDESSRHSPALRPAEFGYAFRGTLSGMAHTKIKSPDETAMIFDSSDLRRNASGELDLLPSPPRYSDRDPAVNCVAFVDGHAKFVPSPGVLLK